MISEARQTKKNVKHFIFSAKQEPSLNLAYILLLTLAFELLNNLLAELEKLIRVWA